MPQMTTTDTQEGRPLDVVTPPPALPTSATNTPITAQVSHFIPFSVQPPPEPSAEGVVFTDASHRNLVSTALDTPSGRPDPLITLTFLLVTGQRRTLEFPVETTVTRVKEILWHTWSVELFGEQPPSPNFLRLVHLGKIWTDEVRLIDINLTSTPQQPAVIHLSVRPFLPPGDDPSSSKRRKSKRTNTSETTDPAPTHSAVRNAHGCCCIIC